MEDRRKVKELNPDAERVKEEVAGNRKKENKTIIINVIKTTESSHINQISIICYVSLTY